MNIKKHFKYKNLNNFFSNNYVLIFKLIILINLILLIVNKLKIHQKRVGIIGLNHSQNIGNNLLKYSIFIILQKFGFEPYIVGKHSKHTNISFLKKYTNLRIIKNFREIKKKDYKLLIVNSDQTWRKWNKDFYNIAFLKFAQNWDIPKFIYGTSIRTKKWKISQKDRKLAKNLLKHFTGISVREINLSKLIKDQLGMKSILVLDPTLLIDKRYYLNIIKNYKIHINIKNNYIFTYKVNHSELKKKMNKFINESSQKLNYRIYNVSFHDAEYIEKFLFGIKYCKAVVTDSFHGTLFSIIFHKPFISFKRKDDERLQTLKEIFGLKNRIIESDEYADVNLLKHSLVINKAKMNKLKIMSYNYLKKNLLIK